MASGNTMAVFSPLANQPPAANNAAFNTRNAQACLDFPDAVSAYAVFVGVLPRNYAGGGLKVTLVWAPLGTAGGNVVWSAAFERLQDGVGTIASDNFAGEQSVTSAAPATSGVVKYSEIAFTSGAQMASLAGGEAFRLKVRRDGANGSDTDTDTVQLVRVEIRET